MRNLFQPWSPGASQHVAAVKRWAAEAFQLLAGTTVMVTELRCTEPGDPPPGNGHSLLPPAGGHPPAHGAEGAL